MESVIFSVIDDEDNQNGSTYDEDNYNSDTLIDAFKEIGDQFKDAWNELLKELSFKDSKDYSPLISNAGERIGKKCIPYSAPLIDLYGQTVKCKYCNIEQTLQQQRCIDMGIIRVLLTGVISGAFADQRKE